VRIRVVGAYSLGWVEVIEAWGGSAEAVVVDCPDPFKDIRGLVSSTNTTTSRDAYLLLPLGAWDGCMAANLTLSQDSDIVATLFKQWRPAIVILSVHASLSRNDTLALLPSGLPLFYQKKMITVCHENVGGVTSASWHFVHYTRWMGFLSYPSIMTSISLPCLLQTALSDMNGAARGATFEVRLGTNPPEAIGVLSSYVGDNHVPVFSGDSVAPDLSCIPFKDVHIWVCAHSVYLKALILRQAKTRELMAVWDYEGKLESRRWSQVEGEHILRAWLSSPPAKMLQCFAQAVCDSILQKLQGGPIITEKGEAPDGLKGLTREIGFSPLKEKATTRVAAAQADFAEIDLLAWSLPSETIEEAKARVVLRQFVSRWWAYNLEKEAMRWWNWNGCNPQDFAQSRTASSEPVPVPIGTGIGGPDYSLGGSLRISRGRCGMAAHFSILPHAP
jgi:hypothetical protein